MNPFPLWFPLGRRLLPLLALAACSSPSTEVFTLSPAREAPPRRR